MLSNTLEREGLRVLLVDDDLDYLTWAERSWSRRGFQLSMCESVDEARKRLLTEVFDAVISDSVVSRTTRTNALAIAAQVCPGIPRVLVSGKDEVEVRRLATEVHATAWLTKPFNHSALVEALAVKPVSALTRGFVWREGALVFVVGPPQDSWPVADRLVGELEEHGAVVVADGGHPAESHAFAEHLLASDTPLQAVGFASTDPDARRRWSRLKPRGRIVVRAFVDLTAAVEWSAVRANMAATLRPRDAAFVGDTPEAPRPRVLVVDDDPPIRLLVARFLTKLGAEVLTACDVAEAEELLGDGPVDAAIIDKNMPGRSGMELLRKLETEMLGVATVMMTAEPTQATRHEANTLGAIAYLEKPFALSELQAALSTALQGVAAAGDSSRLEAVTEMLREMSAWAQRRR